MSGVKPITSYFKVLTKDELEIEELKESQSSTLSRVISNQSARTCSTLSTKELLEEDGPEEENADEPDSCGAY